MRHLVAHFADIEGRDLNNRTPLLVCGGAAYRQGAETLYDLGADMFATRPEGRNFGRVWALQFLVEELVARYNEAYSQRHREGC